MSYEIQHTHSSRDLVPRGECPACDAYRGRALTFDAGIEGLADAWDEGHIAYADEPNPYRAALRSDDA